MKTEYRRIAMRCTQEQFDSIKDRIPLPIIDIFSFDDSNYLVTSYDGDKEVSNIKGGNAKNFNREVYETFDGELFLDCCGREKEVIIEENDKNKAEALEFFRKCLSDSSTYKYEDIMIAFANKKIKETQKNMNSNNCEYKSWYADKLKKKVDELDDFDIHCANVIKGYLKDKIWKGGELQYQIKKGVWVDYNIDDFNVRLKPQPDYSKEIEALENKAKENGQKVIIKIESWQKDKDNINSLSQDEFYNTFFKK